MVGYLAFVQHSLEMLAKYTNANFVSDDMVEHSIMMRRWLLTHLITRCGGTRSDALRNMTVAEWSAADQETEDATVIKVYQHKTGKTTDSLCDDCGEKDSIQHFLHKCTHY